ncbi:hypothetical protein [Streptomyces sp. NPDC021096]|uniref:hypothetical protein n=1 Tax=Streptomyces sp. NPDC021096 TaxID=3154792 RepID=UPI0033DC288B
MDPELEAFIPFLPQLDMNDPVTSRKNFSERAAAAPPPDTSNMEVEDRTVPADLDVAVRVYRPHQAQGAIVWLHGGGGVSVTWTPSIPGPPGSRTFPERR